MPPPQLPAANGDVTRAKMGIVGSIVALLVASVSGGIYMLRTGNEVQPVSTAPQTPIATPAPPTEPVNGSTSTPAPKGKEKEKVKEKGAKLKPPPPDPG